ncbi:MAG: Cd(II)/Pb(II)-responsive transcriptional regulator [Pseudomonadota bacterium]
MKIGDLAKSAHTQTETIRYYEREGLLPQANRSAANYRVYDETHVKRLAFIRHCRSLDMTLGEIQALLHFKDSPKEDCGEVNALLDEHIDHVEIRIRELRTLQKELKGLRLQCVSKTTADGCGILSGLEEAAVKQNHKPATQKTHPMHVHGTHHSVGSTAEK